MPIVQTGDASASALGMVPLAVRPGDTLTVSNLATSAVNLNVFQNGIDQAPTTLTPGNSATVSTAGPCWIQSVAGVATAQVTGGMYGGV